MKIENMLQRFSCISLLFKLPRNIIYIYIYYIYIYTIYILYKYSTRYNWKSNKQPLNGKAPSNNDKSIVATIIKTYEYHPSIKQ